jgi:DNA-binding HxlR family transcriptional regulator
MTGDSRSVDPKPRTRTARETTALMTLTALLWFGSHVQINRHEREIVLALHRDPDRAHTLRFHQRLLKNLEARGLVRVSSAPGSGQPDRYALTISGRAWALLDIGIQQHNARVHQNLLDARTQPTRKTLRSHP